MTTTYESAVLVGGPMDGREISAAVNNALPVRAIHIPPPTCDSPLACTFDTPCWLCSLPIERLVGPGRYMLALRYGHPSRDDAGRLRYEWKGWGW